MLCFKFLFSKNGFYKKMNSKSSTIKGYSQYNIYPLIINYKYQHYENN